MGALLQGTIMYQRVKNLANSLTLKIRTFLIYADVI